MAERLLASKEVFGDAPQFYEGDLRHYNFISNVLKEHKPDAVVHVGAWRTCTFRRSSGDSQKTIWRSPLSLGETPIIC